VAQLASILLSTANSSPSSQAAQSHQPDSVAFDFPTMLSRASSSEHAASGRSTSGAPASDGASGINAGSARTLFSGKIQSLLEKGVSLDRISNAIASKLVALADGKNGSCTKATEARVAAVAAYLKQGESGAQDAQTTANDIVKKVVTLLSALGHQNASTDASGVASSTDAGKILDASQAGDTPITQSTPQSTTHATNQATAQVTTQTLTQAEPAAGTLQYALAALLLPSRQGPPSLSALSSDSSSGSAPLPLVPAVSTALAAPVGAQAAPMTSLPQASAGSIDAQSTGPRVDTGLQAIAAGEGTALERALIRAAGASVVREPMLAGDARGSSLAALSASLDQLFGEAMGQGTTSSNTPGGSGTGPVQTADPMPSLMAAFGLTDGAAQGSAGTRSTSAPTVAQSPIPLDEIMDQIVSGLSLKNFHDNPTVSIALNPPDLGRLSVKISVSDSNVTASVVTPSSEVQSALLAHRSQLDQLFASAGLKLGNLNVDVSGQGLGEEAASRQAQRESFLAAQARASRPIENMACGDSAKQESGPSMLGSVNLNLLDQLV
jgi:flagellar hook-length control protein FliK